MGSALAERGILALVADYRLHPEVRYPEFLHDSARALAFGFENSPRLGGDANRVFVMGHSAGAYNAAMLALDERWLAGVGRSPRELAGFIGLAGPYDFFPTENPDAQPVFFHPSYPEKAQPIELSSPAAPRSFLAAPGGEEHWNVAQTIGSGTASIPVGPTTTKRSMETTTIARDSQTIVVGGLVRDNLTISERKVPFFGDIPWLGWLFRFQSKQTEKLNLLVFLTPHLIRDEGDIAELSQRKAKELNILQRDNRIEEPTRLKQDVLEHLERPAPTVESPAKTP